MEERSTPAGGDSLQAAAHGLIAGGAGKQPPGQRSIVKPGAADKNRQPSPGLDLADDACSVAGKLRGGVDRRRLDDVNQVMGDAPPLLERHLVGADVEPAINRRRIAVDDLAAEAFGEREREGALATRGRPEDGCY